MYTIALVFLTLFSSASLAQSGESAIQQRLTGEWQLGLTSENKAEPAIENMSLGLLGPVWQFKADGTFAIHFPCNLDIPLKLKDVVARGKWDITRSGQLHILVTEPGDWRGESQETYDIRFSHDKGGLEIVDFGSSKAGRFDGAKVNCGKSTKYLRAR